MISVVTEPASPRELSAEWSLLFDDGYRLILREQAARDIQARHDRSQRRTTLWKRLVSDWAEAS